MSDLRPALAAQRFRSRDGVAAWAGAAFAFVLCLFLFTRANQFPYHYHPDEPSKAEQVATGNYNFNHPQLLLRAAEAASLVRTGDLRGRVSADEPMVPHYQRIVVGGRWASATFAAGAAGVMAYLATRRRGLIAGLATAAGLAVLPSLLTAAHFFKEDTVLTFTLALWLAAAAWHLGRRSWPSALALALACGLTLGGKWIGAVLTVLGLVLIIAAPPRRRSISDDVRMPTAAPGAAEVADVPSPARPKHGGVLRWRAAGTTATLGVVLLFTLLINLPALWQTEALIAGLERETTHVTTGHQGLVRSALAVHGRAILELGPVALLLACVEVVVTAVRRERRWHGWWLVPALAIGWFALVAGSRVASERYVIPCVVLLTLLAGMGLATVCELVTGALRQRARNAALALAGGVATAALLAVLWLGPLGLKSLAYLRHFQHDTRDDVRAWIQTNLPGEGRLIFDDWTGLQPWDVPMPSELQHVPFEAGATAETLAAEGFTHLVIADLRYNRYLDPEIQAAEGEEEWLAHLRAQYGRLVPQAGTDEPPDGSAAGLLQVFEPRLPRPTHMSPRVLVYRLPSARGESN